MAMIVARNSASAMALGEFNRNNNKLEKSLKKVSSGMRINGAGDGGAEFAISEKMRVMIRSLGQDIDNSKKGIDLVKVAEDGIRSIIDELRDMKSMALNSANAHNTDIDRTAIQKEFLSRIEEINDIADTTSYNGRVLLDGTYWYKEYEELVPVRRTASVRMYLSVTNTGAQRFANNIGISDAMRLPSSPSFAEPMFSLKSNALDGEVHFDSFSSGSASNLYFDKSAAPQPNTITGIVPAASGKYLGTAASGTGYGGVRGYMPEFYRIIGYNGDKADIYHSDQEDPMDSRYNKAYSRYEVLTATPGTIATTDWSHSNSSPTYYEGTLIREPGTGRIVIEQNNPTTGVAIRHENTSANLPSGVELNFSTSATYPDTFHGQGFTILASQTVDTNGAAHDRKDWQTAGTLVSVIFDATQDFGTGTLLTEKPMPVMPVDPTNPTAAQRKYYDSMNIAAFVIGIKGADSAKEIGNALYTGLRQATSDWPPACKSTVASNGVRMNAFHQIELVKFGDRYALSFLDGCVETTNGYKGDIHQGDVAQRFVIYNGVLGISGTLAELPSSGGDDTVPGGGDTVPGGDDTVPGGGDTVPGGDDTVPGGGDTVPGGDDTVPGGGDTVPGGDDTVPGGGDTVSGGDDVEYYRKRWAEGNPLIIHTGPKANQHLVVFINDMHSDAMGLKDVSVDPLEKALEAIDKLDAALEYALNENTRMGAYQVRLQETIDTLDTRYENVVASESVIRDADMAKEMASYTKNNILSQAAQTMLAQANQDSAMVLTLLQ